MLANFAKDSIVDVWLNAPLNAVVSNLRKNVTGNAILKSGHFHSVKWCRY